MVSMFEDFEPQDCVHSRTGQFFFPRSYGWMCLDCGEHLEVVDDCGGSRDGLKGWSELQEPVEG